MIALSDSDYRDALRSSGVKAGDTLFVHIDTMIGVFFDGKSTEERLQHILSGLEEVVGSEGTLIFPTFTYSFCKNETFDVSSTLCQVKEMGHFPNFILNSNSFVRTADPIFSVAIKGRLAVELLKVNYKDSFGPQSIFDEFYKLNGKIVCIGCSLDRATFIHYCEKKIGVEYRYDKIFSGTIQHTDKSKEECSVNYFVRDLNLKLTSDLTLLKEKLKEGKKLRVVPLARAAIYTVSAHDFFDEVKIILNNNPYGLVKLDNSL